MTRGIGRAQPLDAVHAAFIQGPVSVIVASRNAELVPDVVRGCGCRVARDRRQVTVLIEPGRASSLLDDIATNGLVAVVFSQPSTHRTEPPPPRPPIFAIDLTDRPAGVHSRCTPVDTTMKHVGIKQARESLPELVHRAEAGEEIVITRQGKAVARLVRAPRAPKALPTLQEFRRTLGRDGTPAVQLVRDERNAR